jgi:hypothetical protein
MSKNMESTKNGQSAALNLSNEQLQVILTGKFGDGCLSTPKSCVDNSLYSSSCIYEEYVDYKMNLLGELSGTKSYTAINGYSKKPIWQFHTHVHPSITAIKNMDIESSLNLMDDLGLALWFYDDGSLHKTKLFYNLNTQAFSEEINRDLFVPFLSKFNIKAKPTIERKKDGKEYWYLRIGRYDGAYEVSKILNKYPINCYNYKVWSSETIQNWSKLQEQLKSVDSKDFSTRKIAAMLKRIENESLL